MPIHTPKKVFSRNIVEIASKGVLCRVVESRLRDCESKAADIAALRLFGPSADFEIREGDNPIVQALKETAKNYSTIKDSVTPECIKLANDMLASILKQLLVWEGVLNNHLALSVRLLVEQARIESHERESTDKKGASTEAELVELISRAKNSGVSTAPLKIEDIDAKLPANIDKPVVSDEEEYTDEDPDGEDDDEDDVPTAKYTSTSPKGA